MENTPLREFSERVLETIRPRSEQAEVFAVSRRFAPVSFEANRLKQVETKETSGVALRVVSKGRVGLASTTKLQDADRLADDAIAVAQFGAPARFELPGHTDAPPVDVFDPAVADWPLRAMVELGQCVVDRVREVHSGILVSANVSKMDLEIRLINSRGAHCEYRRTQAWIAADANLIRGTDMLDVYESSGTCRLGVDADGVVERLTRKIRWSERIVPASLGQVPVIFLPKGVAGTLLLPLRSAFNGKLVLQGASPLSRKLGDRVFDPQFALYDDGLHACATQTTPWDDEGIPSRRTPLIEAGTVAAFYYDLQSAGLAGTQSTGNANRELSSLPSPAPRSWTIPAGDASFEAMLKTIQRGVVVDQTLGAWSGNVMGGEFSGNVHLGFQVEGGEIVGRVKDTMVAGNSIEALKEVLAIGDLAQWVNGSVLTPSLAFSALGVSSKA